MVKKLLLFLLLVCQCVALAQVSGHVLNSETKKPIPYVNICNEDGGVLEFTDEKGNYKLTNQKFSKQLFFTSVGYEKQVIVVDKIPDTIFLKPKIIRLEEVVILKKKNTRSVRVGNTEGERAIIYDFTELPNTGLWTVAKYFPSDKLYETMSFLKKVKIRTYCDVKDTFFTIRLYSKGENGKPDGLLYDKDITEEVKRDDRILTFDVSELNIVLPSDGFFVAVERMLPEEERKLLRNGRIISSKTGAGPGLVTIKDKTATDTFMIMKGVWTQWTRHSAAIEIEVTN